MAEAYWTPKRVGERFEEAADTLRRLPGDRRHAAHSAWPPVIHEFWEMIGQEPARLRRGPPTAAAIDRLDQCFEWLRWLEVDDARLVWLRASGVRWKTLCWRFGANRTTLWRRWAAALLVIAAHLDARHTPPVRRLPGAAALPFRGCRATTTR